MGVQSPSTHATLRLSNLEKILQIGIEPTQSASRCSLGLWLANAMANKTGGRRSSRRQGGLHQSQQQPSHEQETPHGLQLQQSQGMYLRSPDNK